MGSIIKLLLALTIIAQCCTHGQRVKRQAEDDTTGAGDGDASSILVPEKESSSFFTSITTLLETLPEEFRSIPYIPVWYGSVAYLGSKEIRILVLLCCVTFVTAKPNNPVYPRTDSAYQRNPVYVGPNNPANAVAAQISNVDNIGQYVRTRNPTYLRNQRRPIKLVASNNPANAVAAEYSLSQEFWTKYPCLE
ncbi:unnamed protein product [Pieris macdunnoughi]|uniref:Uncharacterized protein n=1 Tax=Pieris macdunnoughi TaxID=345717 RepID=A0A821PNX5_9NEOP|nr:unnamed protein product [Pieris macdunnoughi]